MSTYRPAAEAAPSPAFTVLPDSRFTTLGGLAGYEVRGSTLVLDAGGPRLAVTLLADDLARVRFAPGGDFRAAGHGADAHETPFSYALAPGRAWNYGDLDVEDTGAELLVRTPALTLRVNKRPLRLTFETPDGRPFLADAAGVGIAYEGDTDGDRRSHIRCWKQAGGDARFFGLGDKTFPLDRAGGRYTFWNADTYAYGPEQDPIYKSIPFTLGLHRDAAGWLGYGLFFDNTFRGQWDLGAERAEQWSFGAEGGELRYYVFAPAPGDAAGLKTPLARYCDLTGHKPMPARWALGYHQSRWNYHDDGYALWIAHEFRRRGIPLDCVHLDIGHMDGFRVFTWHLDGFRDPAGMNEELRTLGVRSVVIVDPGVKVDDGYFAYRDGLAADVFCKNPDGSPFTDTVWPGNVHWPDFTNPDARAWWGDQHRRYLDTGVAGFWNDMNEPAILGGRDFPDEVRFAFGDRGDGPTDHREAHNVYGQLMARATHEGLLEARPDERPFLLTRACFSGSQRYAAAWTGDNVSSWEHLLLALRICQSLSASGLAFCGPDIGGFAGRPSGELYARWMQAGVFFPFMRTHYSHEEIDQQEPWSFGDEAEAVCRRYIGLRYELMPYLYSAFVACCQTAVPPMKALFLEHPADPATHAADDTFYFGPALLVAPVVQDGARQREVYLPDVPGGFYDFWTDGHVGGGKTVTADAPLATMPMFARAGECVAMHPVMMHTDEFAPDVLVLRTFPGTGHSTTYFDDGLSFAYRDGDYLRLTVDMTNDDGRLDFAVSREGGRHLPYHHFEWQIARAGLSGATSAHADGRALPLFNDPEAFVAAPEGVFVDGARLRVRTRTDVARLSVG